MDKRISDLETIETVSNDMHVMVVAEGKNYKLTLKDLLNNTYWECMYCATITRLERCPSCGAPRKDNS